VAAARYTIEQGERRRRAAAVEYLDNLLGGVVRKRVMPILDDTPLADKVRYANGVLRSRPRDLEDTLAQLVHDDDQVIAASAIHFVERRQLWSLADDLEYISSHRPDADSMVREAAAWALASRRAARAQDGLPVVELVDRIRAAPLFAALSIDELFRVAEAGQQVRHQAGRELYRAGQEAEDVFFLLDGAVESTSLSGAAREVAAPAAVNVEEVLQGTPLARTTRAIEHVVGFRVSSSAFLTMVLENVLMAQSLFALLLGGRLKRLPYTPAAVPSAPGMRAPAGVRLFRQDPLLANATAAQLLALRAAASEVTIAPGTILFDLDDAPAIYQVLEGELRLESADQDAIVASAGATFGVAEALAGTPSGWRATGTSHGRAMRLDRDDLFAVMAEHVELMQGLFGATLAMDSAPSAGSQPQPEHPYFA
jgi:CRP-like cAMP-binding protein